MHYGVHDGLADCYGRKFVVVLVVETIYVCSEPDAAQHEVLGCAYLLVERVGAFASIKEDCTSGSLEPTILDAGEAVRIAREQEQGSRGHAFAIDPLNKPPVLKVPQSHLTTTVGVASASVRFVTELLCGPFVKGDVKARLLIETLGRPAEGELPKCRLTRGPRCRS